MALMLSRLYAALRLANVPDDEARAAAEEVATYEQVKRDTYLLKWMLGGLIAVVLGVFWMQWQTIAKLGELQGAFGGIQIGLANVENRLTNVESRLGSVEGGLAALDTRLSDVEAQLDGSASGTSQP